MSTDRVALAYAQRMCGDAVLGHVSAARFLAPGSRGFDINRYVVHVPYRVLGDTLTTRVKLDDGAPYPLTLIPSDLDELPRSDDADVVSAERAMFDLEERRDILEASCRPRLAAVSALRPLIDDYRYRRLVMDYSQHRNWHRF